MRPSSCFWLASFIFFGLCACHGTAQTPAPAAPDCNAALVSLLPCLDYVQGNVSTPPQNCCAGLGSVVQSNPICLCALFNSSALPIQVNTSRALQLPAACKVTTPNPSLCGGGAAPVQAPVSSPPVSNPVPPVTAPPTSTTVPPPSGTPPMSAATPPAAGTPPQSAATPPVAETPRASATPPAMSIPVVAPSAPTTPSVAPSAPMTPSVAPSTTPSVAPSVAPMVAPVVAPSAPTPVPTSESLAPTPSSVATPGPTPMVVATPGTPMPSVSSPPAPPPADSSQAAPFTTAILLSAVIMISSLLFLQL